METEEEEQRSTQRWQQLQRAAAMEELVVPAELDDDSWDRRAQHHADADADAHADAAGGDDDDGLEIRRDPMVRGWRWLKAVSMVVFSGSGRPNKKTTTEMEPLYPPQPQEPRSDDQSRMAAREVNIRLRSPQRRAREADVSKLNSPQRRTNAQVQPSLPPQQQQQQVAEFGSKNSLPEVVMDVASTRTAQVCFLTCPAEKNCMDDGCSARPVRPPPGSTPRGPPFHRTTAAKDEKTVAKQAHGSARLHIGSSRIEDVAPTDQFLTPSPSPLPWMNHQPPWQALSVGGQEQEDITVADMMASSSMEDSRALETDGGHQEDEQQMTQVKNGIKFESL